MRWSERPPAVRSHLEWLGRLPCGPRPLPVAVAHLVLVRPLHTLDSLMWHVMGAMADDWESIVQIRPHVFQYCGATPDERIFQILRQLHEKGLVRVMDLDGHGTDRFPPDPQESWFDMTDAGRLIWDTERSKYRDEHEQV